jgi:hypothetical protein
MSPFDKVFALLFKRWALQTRQLKQQISTKPSTAPANPRSQLKNRHKEVHSVHGEFCRIFFSCTVTSNFTTRFNHDDSQLILSNE